MQPHIHREQESEMSHCDKIQQGPKEVEKKVILWKESFSNYLSKYFYKKNSKVGGCCHCLNCRAHERSLVTEEKHTSGTSVRLLQWRVWKKNPNVNLINVRSGTFCQRGRESRKKRRKKKKAAVLPTHHPPSSGRDVIAELPFDGSVGGFPCHYAVSKLHLMLTHGR